MCSKQASVPASFSWNICIHNWTWKNTTKKRADYDLWTRQSAQTRRKGTKKRKKDDSKKKKCWRPRHNKPNNKPSSNPNNAPSSKPNTTHDDKRKDHVHHAAKHAVQDAQDAASRTRWDCATNRPACRSRTRRSHEAHRRRL